MCRVASIASRNGREVADAHDPVRAGSGASLQLERGEEGERALGADQQVGQVVAPAARRAHVEVVAADLRAAPSASGARSRRASRAASAAQRRRGRGSAGPAGLGVAGTGAEAARAVPSARSASMRQHVVDHVAVADASARRSELLAAMPPSVARLAVEASTGKKQPVGLSARFRSSRTRPGWTSRCRPPASTSRTRCRCRLVSSTSASPTVWPYCELPPPRGQDRDAGRARGRPPPGRPRRPRHHHADRLDLVDRGVGRVAAAPSERGDTRHLAAQTALQRASCERRRTDPPGSVGRGRPHRARDLGLLRQLLRPGAW